MQRKKHFPHTTNHTTNQALVQTIDRLKKTFIFTSNLKWRFHGLNRSGHIFKVLIKHRTI